MIRRRLLDLDALEPGEAPAPTRSDRHVSINRLSILTGWDRGTITEWVKVKGCPVVREGARGEDWVLDIGDVWRWREEQVRQDAVRRAGAAGIGEDGKFEGFLGIKDPAKAADAQLKFMKVGVLAGELVPHERMHGVLERTFAALRNAIMAIPDRLYRDMSGFPDDLKKRWRTDAFGHCRAALASAVEEVERALRALQKAAAEEANEQPPSA